MDHITVSGQVVPVPSNWSDTDIKNFAAGIKSKADHITIGGQAYAVPSSWTDKSIQDYANALKTGMRQSAPKPEQPGAVSRFVSNAVDAINPIPAIQEWMNRPSEIAKLTNGIGGTDAEVDAAMNANVQQPEGNLLAERAGPAMKAVHQMTEGDIAGGAGTLVGGYAVPAAVAKGVSVAGPVVGKYGSRAVENSPAVGKAAANVGESMAPNLKKGAIATAVASGLSTVAPGLGHAATGLITLGTLYKAAAAAVKDGSVGKLGKSIGELVTKPTVAEDIAGAEARSPWLDNYSNQSYADVVAKQQASAAPASAPAPVDPVKTAPVRKAEPTSQPMPTTKVEISSRVSPDASTSTMGTKAPAGDATSNYLQSIRNPKPAPVQGPTRTPAWRNVPEAEAPAAQPVQPVSNAALTSGRKPGGIQNQTAATEAVKKLSPETQKILVDAGRGGEHSKLASLPAEDRKAVVEAVKTGDEPTIRKKLSSPLGEDIVHAKPHKVNEVVGNKTAVLAAYAYDHGIHLGELESHASAVDQFARENGLVTPTGDLRSYNKIAEAAETQGRPEIRAYVNQVQGFANKAYDYGVNTHGLMGNGDGKYRGISLDTVKELRTLINDLPGYEDKVKQNAGQAPVTPAELPKPPKTITEAKAEFESKQAARKGKRKAS